MALYFLDTSALVKLYVQEPGTDRLLHLFANQQDDRFSILTISNVELRSAIRRRQRAGDISVSDAQYVLDGFQAHLEARLVVQAVNDAVIDGALEIIDRYALRAYDAIQLAGSLVLNGLESETLTFVCSDRRLLEAAHSERLRILDPAA